MERKFINQVVSKEQMNCKKVHKAIIFYLDGEISDARRDAMDEHLKHCAACKAMVHSMKQTMEAWSGDGTVAKQPFFVDRVMARIAMRDKQHEVYNILPRWALAAAVLILGLGVGMLMGRGDKGVNAFLPEEAAFYHLEQQIPEDDFALLAEGDDWFVQFNDEQDEVE